MLDEKDSEPQIILDQASFEECFEFLEHNRIYGTGHYKSFLKKKPIIEIAYDWCTTGKYKNFDNISIRQVYKEVLHMSLSDIMKKFNAEQVIQYLKEHGLATCPFNESK